MRVDAIAVDSELSDALLPPPPPENTVAGAVDYKGRPALRSKHGRWRSACFIIVVEIAERIAYYGVSSNLITYLTKVLGQSTAMAATNVNAWSGVAYFLPIMGAVVADSFIGKYYTIVAFSIIYILGMGLITLSASCVTNEGTLQSNPGCSQQLQIVTFFVALYLVAAAQSFKPCSQAFGADQFDGEDPNESKSKSSFFNWWYFGTSVGLVLGIGVLSYVQDNLSWALGFGIPSIIMVVAFFIFLSGTTTYRYIEKLDRQSPFKRIGGVFVAAVRNWSVDSHSVLHDKDGSYGRIPSSGSQQYRFLNKALLTTITPKGDDAQIYTMEDIEEAKSVLRLFPIWATSLTFGIFFSQHSTFFTKQGATLDRSIGLHFVVPPASLQSIIGITILIFIPIYDRLFVPIMRGLSGNPTGITTLQRIGTGMFLSVICMAIAAIIEKRRLNTALEHGLIDLPNVTVPMSIWWLLPQYILNGIAEAFTFVGLQEFFYDQVPDELRSVGLSIYLSIVGVGSLLSGVLVTVIDKVTSVGGGDSWFSNNLNCAHLDYFYWFIAGLSAFGLALFIFFAKSYKYKKSCAPIRNP